MNKTMRNTLIVLTALLLAPPAAIYAADAAPAARPNILVIVIDDMGYGDPGYMGNREIPTPHLDALARSGVICTAGYVTASVCSPSRCALMTGRYQTRFGSERLVLGRKNRDQRTGLPLSERTLAEVLRAAGYATGAFGKWHLGGAPPQYPLRRGFDEFFGFLNEGHYYVPPPYQGVVSYLRRKHLPAGARGTYTEGDITWSNLLDHDEPPYDDDNSILRGDQRVEEPDYLTDALTREAIGFIERHKQKPFFLYLPYNAVHSPMQTAKKYLARFANIRDLHRRVFAGMLANLDDGIGQVIAKLRAERLDDNTLVFLISDNGGPTRETTASNRPLRGGKGDLYEGGIRIPFLVAGRRFVPAGLTYKQPVIATNVFATCLAVAGIKMPTDRVMDGVNLLPHLRGEAAGPPHATLYWRMDNLAALRQGDLKIVIQNIRDPAHRRIELFELASDLSETRDLAANRPRVAEGLFSTWQQLNRQMVPPNW